MNKGEKMKCPTKADLYERELACKNKLKQTEHELSRFQWISVNDRLPITADMTGNYNTVDVITFDGDIVMCQEFRAGATFEFWSEFESDDVTHWMPLPSAPIK